MTNQEAIEILKDFQDGGTYDNDSWDIDPEMNETLTMAIEALKAQEAKNLTDAISRQNALDTLRTMQTYKLGANDDMLLVNKAEVQTELMLLPSVQPEKRTEERTETHGVCLDVIDRQAAISYAISGRIRTLPTSEDGENWIRTSEVRQSLLTMPSAQPEIIRCKDCKWFGDIGCAISIVDTSDRPTEMDFCSFAERRGGQE